MIYFVLYLAAPLLLVAIIFAIAKMIKKDEFRVLVRAKDSNEFAGFICDVLDNKGCNLFQLKGTEKDIKQLEGKVIVTTSKQIISFHLSKVTEPKYVGTGNYFRYRIDLTN